MKNIAILGPVNSRGGREIETAFIAHILQKKYEVSIYSTEDIKKENDLNTVNPSLIIYKRYKSVYKKIKAYLGFKSNYDNLYFKKLRGKKTKSLEAVIQKADMVFVIAQLTSNYTKSIIELSSKLEKKIIFRTTGTIPDIDLENDYFSYLKKVDLFINHSERNSIKFKLNSGLNYKIIDQCIYNDARYINFKTSSITSVKKFYCVSRLDKNKDVITVIRAFNKLRNKLNIELHIIGAGNELENLKIEAKHKNIKFYGHLNHEITMQTISGFDCLIISSKEEAGPYSALEAMMLGNLVLSTNIGAMSSRFIDDNIWFEEGNINQLSEKIIQYSNYSSARIDQIKKRYTNRYKNNYNTSVITKSYLDTIHLYLKDNDIKGIRKLK